MARDPGRVAARIGGAIQWADAETGVGDPRAAMATQRGMHGHIVLRGGTSAGRSGATGEMSCSEAALPSQEDRQERALPVVLPSVWRTRVRSRAGLAGGDRSDALASVLYVNIVSRVATRHSTRRVAPPSSVASR